MRSTSFSSCVALFYIALACGSGAEHRAVSDSASNAADTPANTLTTSAPASPTLPPAASASSPSNNESTPQPAMLAMPGANGASATPSAPASNPAAQAPAAPAAPAAPSPAAPSSETCNRPGAAGADTPTLWVIGDSTASLYAATLYPRMGWAQPLQDSFAPACATIQDRAISGRSSKSFFDEGAWTPVRDALKSGDFVLIQFGHNDEKSDDPLRFTDPFTTFQQYLSTYLDDTLARGATPILLTPINRNSWSGATLKDTHGQYPAAVRQLAQTRQLALVDATALTKSYFERIGEAATTLLFMDLAAGQFPNYPDGNVDNTHLQESGARTIGRLILADLARQNSPIARLLQQIPSAP